MGNKTVKIISVHFKNAFRGPMQDVATVDRVWQVSEDSPSRVIYDSDDEMVFATGTPLKLEEGYELAIQAIDLDGNKIYVQLMKSGSVVDSAVIETTPTPEGGENYAYSAKGDDEEETISIRFKDIFRGADQDLAVVDRVRQSSEDQPSKVLIDDDEEGTFTSGTPLKLEEGYELVIAAIDLDGDKAYVELYKDGLQVDSAVITPPRALGSETYTYSIANAATTEDSEIISVHFKNAFRGPDRDVATVDRIWQASEDRPSSVIRESVDEIVIMPSEPLELDEGYELKVAAIDLDGEKVYIQLYKDGAVVDSAVMTPPDLAGDGAYTYSVDADGAGRVELISVHFKNAFRGADQDLATMDLIKQMSEDQPSRVIYGSADETIITSGAPLRFREGYELVVGEIDLDGDKLYVELYKDGNIVDSAIVVPPEATIEDKTYAYVANVGRTEEIVTIAVHFKNAFRGADQDLATVDGIWQISQTPIEIGG